MRIITGQQFLFIYSGILTVAFIMTVLVEIFYTPTVVRARELDVQRINVSEPDGTVRLIISNKAQFPGLIVKGHEFAHKDRQTAGMLFFNDEGTENGGLIFGGARKSNGQVSSYGHLSFDQYMQDQTLTLESNQEGNSFSKNFSIVDRPQYSISDVIPLIEKYQNDPSYENKAAIDAFVAQHGAAASRLYIGEFPDKSVSVELKDEDGRSRLVLRIGIDGKPHLQFLDAKGNIIDELPK